MGEGSEIRMKHELEKVRRYEYLGKDDVFTVIKESDSEEELENLAKTVKLRFGKTFHEVLVINIWDDEHVDIVEVNHQRDSMTEYMKRTGKKWYEL